MSGDALIKLSVVTVCWNDLPNVQRTLQSLERQTALSGWEHVLVDGASSDGTVDWYRSTAFPFPHSVVSEPDNGIFDAMNKSLNIVKGDYVVFMNAGDRYADDEAIGRVLQRIERAPLWGYSRAGVVDIDGRKVRPRVGRIPYSRVAHLLGRATICHQAVFMRIDLLQDLGGFDTDMGTAGDYHLLIRAGARAAPETSTDVDVEFLAGGVSDSGIYDHLWNRHRARVDALALTPGVAKLDSVWTQLQVVQIRARKRFKPLLGPIYLKLRR